MYSSSTVRHFDAYSPASIFLILSSYFHYLNAKNSSLSVKHLGAYSGTYSPASIFLLLSSSFRSLNAKNSSLSVKHLGTYSSSTLSTLTASI
jgi:hypothetical protein